MAKAVPDFYPDTVNQYVPDMQYAADAHMEGLLRYSLGSPSAYDDDALIATATLDLDAGSSTTYTTFDGTLKSTIDATYGRNVVVSPSGDPGAAVQVDVYGRDYLGQPMVESIDIANAQTTDSVGVKTFKFLEKVIIDGNASNATTATVGVGTKLGLPYKFLEVPYAHEGGTLVKADQSLTRLVTSAVTVSGSNSGSITAPFDGYLRFAGAEVTTAVTTAAAVMDFTLNSTGNSAGDFTIPVAAVGFTAGNALTSPIAVSQGDTCTWTSNAGPGAGAAELFAEFSRTLNVFGLEEPDTTDPATITTGDPRGTYDPAATMDGSTEIVVYLRADNTSNSSNNGGLHGIKHYYA